MKNIHGHLRMRVAVFHMNTNPNPYESPREILDEPAEYSEQVKGEGQRRCERCGGHEFRTWRWYHPLLLHWLINPGLAVNELLIGTRIPATTFLCQQCFDWTNAQGQYVECPHCRCFHRAEIWKSNFMNWLGLVCPDCGQFIPCLLNLTSAAILFVTCPLWWPISLLVAPRYKRWGQQRAIAARRALPTPSQPSTAT